VLAEQPHLVELALAPLLHGSAHGVHDALGLADDSCCIAGIDGPTQRENALVELCVALALGRDGLAQTGGKTQDGVAEAAHASHDVFTLGAALIPDEGDQPGPVAKTCGDQRPHRVSGSHLGVLRAVQRGARRAEADASRPLVTARLDRARVGPIGIKGVFTVQPDQDGHGIERLLGQVARRLTEARIERRSL
jgi:hypothetical protein